MRRGSVQLKQLVSTNSGLYGINDKGLMYVYCGQDWGWVLCNMDLMTEQDNKDKKKALKRMGSFNDRKGNDTWPED